MLAMVQSDTFKAYGEKREPIMFHQGLNVVVGSDTATNSLGKSTFLMLLDFIYGGDDFWVKLTDVQENIGNFIIEFAFEFGGKRFYFSRSTDKEIKTVNECDDNFHPLRTLTLNEYKSWLAEKYRLTNYQQTLRGTLSSYFRIYNRDTLNENHPFRSAEKEAPQDSISSLFKLFDVYRSIEDAKKRYEEEDEKSKALKKAAYYGYVFHIKKSQYKENVDKIKELEKRKAELEAKSEKGVATLSDVQVERLESLRKRKASLRRKESNLRSRLDAINSNLNSNSETISNQSFEDLKEFFPGVNVKGLADVENFHRGINKILKQQANEETASIQKELESLRVEIERTEDDIFELTGGQVNNVSTAILKEYNSISDEIKTLEKQNYYFDLFEEQEKTKSDSLESFNASVLSVSGGVENSLNETMEQLNDTLFLEKTESPKLKIESLKKYEFITPNDKGAGTNYKGLIVFDMAMLQLTNLPIVIHDSNLLKQISDETLERIIELYVATPKQIVISIDKLPSYTEKMQKTLTENTVLALSPNGNELFGKAWNKIESR